MKKVFMSVAVIATIMMTGQINAQVNANDKAAQEQITQGEFQEIKLVKLPVAVINAVKTNFENASIGKAYVNDLKHYKLVLEIDGMEKTIYVNEQGEWIKP